MAEKPKKLGTLASMMPAQLEEGAACMNPSITPTELNQLLAYLDNQFKIVEDMQESLQEKITLMGSDIAKINDSLNGTEGLITRVAVMEAIGKNEKESKKDGTSTWIGIAGIIVSVATLMFMLFQVKGK